MKLTIDATSSFSFDVTLEINGSVSEGLLVEQYGDWQLRDRGDCLYAIGRRKTWQKALHDALVWMENQAKIKANAL